MNAVIDDSTNEIVYRNYNDISVAVASPTGLVVPVLRNTEKMSFSVGPKFADKKLYNLSRCVIRISRRRSATSAREPRRAL